MLQFALDPLEFSPEPAGLPDSDHPLTQESGARIGRYTLVQQLGEGGCGVVYLAEQQEPVRRPVAIKIIKPGMDSRQVIARFEAERQALAMMDHPNIATVFDGGTTEAGRPYFVMELVRGARITDYCDQNNLMTRERLALFIQVCQAIQHAHQKGIIHRDIKPSNVLVTLHDAAAVPKVIDFGIAKATDQQLTDKTFFTAFEQFMGTPAYMSPEQAEMGGLDIDTRTDIYSLGVLLYELLTGKTPFDAKELLGAGLDEMRRTIRERRPVRPSTRLSTMLDAELAAAARHRQAEPPKLIHLIRGDLDWIVMTTLEKERARRYQTANALAMDIQRYLDGEPVLARPPSNWYRFHMLVRRNKLAFASAGAVTAALIIGLGLSLLSFYKEKEARQRAQTEAAKSEQVARLLKNMLKGVGPSVALGRDTTMLREILDQTASSIHQELTNQPEVAMEMCLTLAATYDDLGLDQQAEAMGREAVVFARSAFGREHRNVARALRQLGNALSNRGKMAEAEPLVREALRQQRQFSGDQSVEVADALQTLGNVLWGKGQLAEAEKFHREALVIRRKHATDSAPLLAESLNDLAGVLTMERKLAEAEAMYREALGMARALFGDEHPTLAVSMNNLGSVLRRRGNAEEAEKFFRQALELEQKVFGNEHPTSAVSLNNLALLLRAQGKPGAAEAMQRQALAIEQKLLGAEHPQTAVSLRNLASILCDQGKVEEAELTVRAALAVQNRLLGEGNPEVATSFQVLSRIQAQ